MRVVTLAKNVNQSTGIQSFGSSCKQVVSESCLCICYVTVWFTVFIFILTYPVNSSIVEPHSEARWNDHFDFISLWANSTEIAQLCWYHLEDKKMREAHLVTGANTSSVAVSSCAFLFWLGGNASRHALISCCRLIYLNRNWIVGSTKHNHLV